MALKINPEHGQYADLAWRLVQWRQANGKMGTRSTLISDLLPHAIKRPNMQRITIKRVIEAVPYSESLFLGRAKFMRNGITYDAAWLDEFEIEGIRNFNPQAHTDWLADNLRALLADEPQGIALEQIADLMEAQGIGLAPDVPLNRKPTAMQDYIREAVRYIDDFTVAFHSRRRGSKDVAMVAIA